FITSEEPHEKHFLHHINNKCRKDKCSCAFSKILPPKMTNRPESLQMWGKCGENREIKNR
ncbi:MAG: hypothetical protein IK092_03980, partial [Muribaculaceae bacterium]|nr:hypothetical protein [Muribaculaceae bacterium]